MEIDDIRFIWIRDRVYDALDIEGEEVFEELLQQSDSVNERQLAKFLNETAAEYEEAVIFYKTQALEDVEEQIQVCM